VCDPDGDLDAVEGLGSLSEKSLLRPQEGPDGEPRFEMLETIQEYAREKFEESGRTQVVERAHAEYFLALAEAAEPALRGPRQAEWLGRLEEQHGNLRAALAWAMGGGDRGLGLRLAGALGRFWLTRSYLTEGRRWLDAALASSEGMPPAARAKALVGAGSLARDQGDYALGMRLLEESVGLWRELGDRWWTAQALNVLALTADVKGESERAVLLMEEALGLFRELGDDERSAAILINLGATALFRGDYDRSAGLLEEALRSRRLLSPSTLATALLELGIAALATGEPLVAESRIGEGLIAAREVGARSDVEDALEGLAAAAGATGRPERAARLWGAAQTLSAEIAYRPDPDLRAIFAPYIEAARARLGEAAWEEAAAEGRAMSYEEAVEYALEGLAQPAPDTSPREH
jgi:non-specific serine/threonine protein kinase